MLLYNNHVLDFKRQERQDAWASAWPVKKLLDQSLIKELMHKFRVETKNENPYASA